MPQESNQKKPFRLRLLRKMRVPLALTTVAVVLAWQADLFSSKIPAGEVADTRPGIDPDRIEKVKWTGVPRKRFLVGTVAPRSRIALSAQRSGQIRELRVEEGSRVAAGETLAVLDQRVPLAKRDEAASALAGAEAEERGATQLLEHVRQAVAAEAMAEIELVKARRARDAAVQVVAQARAALRVAETQLEFTRLKSPTDGVVLETLREAGDQALIGHPLLFIYDPQALEVEVAVPETLASTLKSGDSMTCHFAALGVEKEATVRVWVPGADPASHTVTAKLKVDLPPQAVPGLYVQVALNTTEEKSLLIPASAIKRVRQLDFVRVVDDDGRAQRRIVRLGRRVGEEVVVLAGLRRSERIVRQFSPDPSPADSKPAERDSAQ